MRSDSRVAEAELDVRFRERFFSAVGSGRRPICPPDFEYPDGAIDLGGWIGLMQQLTQRAFQAYQLGVSDSSLEAVLDSAFGNEDDVDIDDLFRLIDKGERQKVYELVGMPCPPRVSGDLLADQYPELSFLAGELGLSFAGFMAFIAAANRKADREYTDMNGAWMTTWVALCQYSSAEQLFEAAGHSPTPECRVAPVVL